MEKNKKEVKRERTKRDNKEERCVLDTYTGRALSVLNKAFIRWTIQLNSLPYSAWKTMIVKAREILKDFTLCGVGCIGEEGISLFTKRSSAVKKSAYLR